MNSGNDADLFTIASVRLPVADYRAIRDLALSRGEVTMGQTMRDVISTGLSQIKEGGQPRERVAK